MMYNADYATCAIRMVFQQPLVPVLPVARELISKTKWFASKTPQTNAPQKSQPVVEKGDGPSALPSKKRSRTHSPHRRRPKVITRPSTPPGGFTIPILAMEPGTPDDPEQGDAEDDPSRTSRPRGRSRILGFFSRASSRSRKRSEYDGSTRVGDFLCGSALKSSRKYF
jgi:hypothetical protein